MWRYDSNAENKIATLANTQWAAKNWKLNRGKKSRRLEVIMLAGAILAISFEDASKPRRSKFPKRLGLDNPYTQRSWRRANDCTARDISPTHRDNSQQTNPPHLLRRSIPVLSLLLTSRRPAVLGMSPKTPLPCWRGEIQRPTYGWTTKANAQIYLGSRGDERNRSPKRSQSC